MKKLIAALLFSLWSVAAFADTTSTHYSFISPTIGNTTNWGLSLNSNFASLDSNLWNAAGGLSTNINSSSSATDIVLINPLVTFQSITFSTSGRSLVLPPMNATSSMLVGKSLTIYNAGSNSFSIKAQDGATVLYSGLTAAQYLRLWLTSNGTANGSWTVEGPYATNTVYLGTTTTSTNPQSSVTPTTGLYSTTSANVGVSVLGTSVGQWTSTGLNSTAIGATTSSTAVFSSATAATAILSGLTYPTTDSTAGKAITTNGSGTLSLNSMRQVIAFGNGGSSGTAATTYYLGTSCLNVTEGTCNLLFPIVGLLKNLDCQVSTAPGAGHSVTFTMRVNGSTVNETCTISDTANSCQDLTHTDGIGNATTVANIQVVYGAAAVTSFPYCSVEYDNP